MQRIISATLCVGTVLLAVLGATSCGVRSVEPLVLAQNGKTNYEIVIGKEADYGESQAAQELALFLKIR